jgi:hypothetical protein
MNPPHANSDEAVERTIVRSEGREEHMETYSSAVPHHNVVTYLRNVGKLGGDKC